MNIVYYIVIIVAFQAALGRDSYSFSHAGGCLAAAASQAIAATQQVIYNFRFQLVQ